MKEFLENK